ncbi:MAG: peptide chain release factor 2 [Phycisphaerae bacterium]|nr:peptide chain release factor 2 [Phycisphaerae bacterium]
MPNDNPTEALEDLSSRIIAIRDSLDLPGKSRRLEELSRKMEAPDFWGDRATAEKVVAELKALKAVVEPIEALTSRTEDMQVLLGLAEEEKDESALHEVAGSLDGLTQELDRIELMTMLSGTNDAGNCYFKIQSGAGGTESQDWAEMLLRMYLRFFEQTGYKAEELSRKDGEEAGIQSVELLVKGPYAYGYLSCEAGVHRLIRLSPFDSGHRRHTSFAAVDVLAELEDIQIEINWETDVREDTYRASGAGGQHVNKTSSAIRLTHATTGIVVQCQNERSQHKNRALARRMLASRLLRREEQLRNAELAALYDEKGEIAFGGQIRTYWLHPSQRVKDNRTGVEMTNADLVLDGDIQPFIDAELRRRASRRKN